MTDTGNRILWIVIGAVLAALGVLGILAHLGKLGFAANLPLLWPGLLTAWRNGGAWSFAVAIAIGVIAVLLGLWLFSRQFLRRGATVMGDVTVADHTGEDTSGRTRVRAGGLVKALRTDLASNRAVTKAEAVLTGRTDHPHAWIRLDLAPGAALDPLRRHVDSAMERFTTTSGVTPAHVDVTVRPSPGGQARVR